MFTLLYTKCLYIKDFVLRVQLKLGVFPIPLRGNKELFGKIFEMKGNCKITLRHNKKDADMFKKEIKKYFK